MSEAFKFLHASDFHLEQPLYGVAEVPDDWRHLFVDAPLQAARKVFEAAVKEEVDFVVLSGDLLDPPTAGPRAISFLLDQFQLLHERVSPSIGLAARSIASKSGPRDCGSRRAYNFFRTTSPTTKSRTCVGTNHWLRFTAERSTRSGDRSSGFDHDDAEMIAIAPVTAHEAAVAATLRMDYWALGGKHQRRTLNGLAATAHYAGSPQGHARRKPGAWLHLGAGRRGTPLPVAVHCHRRLAVLAARKNRLFGDCLAARDRTCPLRPCQEVGRRIRRSPATGQLRG